MLSPLPVRRRADPRPPKYVVSRLERDDRIRWGDALRQRRLSLNLCQVVVAEQYRLRCKAPCNVSAIEHGTIRKRRTYQALDEVLQQLERLAAA